MVGFYGISTIVGYLMPNPLYTYISNMYCSVSCGCRIHRLLLCRGVRPHPKRVLSYDTKQSDGDVPVMLELWEMWSTPSLPLLQSPLWPRVVAPDWALSIG